MDVQGILTKIETDAREAASAILADAQKRADEMRMKSDRQAEAQREAMEKRVVADSREMQDRMMRMAELEDKKAQLAVKREAMDQAFLMAMDSLRKLPDEKKRAFFKEQLLSAAKGDEQLCIGKTAGGWFTPALLAEVNEALAKKGLPGKLSQGENIPGCGFELRRGGESLNCTFEALVAGSRMNLEGEVALTLFAQ